MSEKIIGARVEFFVVEDDGTERAVEMFSVKGPNVSVAMDSSAGIGTIDNAGEPLRHYHTGARHWNLRVDVRSPGPEPRP